jgi:hypothetical protein
MHIYLQKNQMIIKNICPLKILHSNSLKVLISTKSIRAFVATEINSNSLKISNPTPLKFRLAQNPFVHLPAEGWFVATAFRFVTTKTEIHIDSLKIFHSNTLNVSISIKSIRAFVATEINSNSLKISNPTP